MAPLANSSFVRAALAVAACVAAVASVGCGSLVPSTADAGAYDSRDLKPAQAHVVVDRAASTVTFTVPGAAPVVRSFTAVDREKWPIRCRMNFKAAQTELLDLGPDALQLGALRFEHPVLMADCYHSGTSLELETMGADGEPNSSVRLAFYR